jgi:hypothetical protein
MPSISIHTDNGLHGTYYSKCEFEPDVMTSSRNFMESTDEIRFTLLREILWSQLMRLDSNLQTVLIIT